MPKYRVTSFVGVDTNSSTQIAIRVDNEESILSTLKRFMRHSQYQCFYANSGKEALQILEDEVIDVVVSDMKMPEMNGEELLKKVHRTIEKPTVPIKVKETISNLNRSFGTLISGEIAKYYGDKGLPENSINFELNGIAGQSLGAFLSKGMNIHLYGAANDYVGKGMHGGKIIITTI